MNPQSRNPGSAPAEAAPIVLYICTIIQGTKIPTKAILNSSYKVINCRVIWISFTFFVSLYLFVFRKISVQRQNLMILDRH